MTGQEFRELVHYGRLPLANPMGKLDASQVIAALVKDLKPPIEELRRLIAR